MQRTFSRAPACWVQRAGLVALLGCGDGQTMDARPDAGAADSGKAAAGSSGSSGGGAGMRAERPGGAGGGGSLGGRGGAGAGAGAAGRGGGSAGVGGSVAAGGALVDRYPGDVGIGEDPAVLFHDDFEAGWGRWDSPQADTMHLHLESDASAAHGGRGYLRSTVTRQHLEQQMYISSSTRVDFPRRADRIYVRFHARFPELAPNPHHWLRIAAGTDDYASSGRANTVPPGDQGFWFDFDADNDDRFNFYAYWYKMRSGRCNDGSATPGCAGDQGMTYYYGNVFQPRDQAPFPRDRWFCVEIFAQANEVGQSDGVLAFFIDDEAIGDYGPGRPEGTWLRAQYHEGGCDFSACTEPAPFAGFDFRASEDVRFKSLFLDAYYERATSADKRAVLEERGLAVSDAQTILYDDVVVATERVGCLR